MLIKGTCVNKEKSHKYIIEWKKSKIKGWIMYDTNYLNYENLFIYGIRNQETGYLQEHR